MPQSFTNLQYHIIFSVKDRQPLITPDIRSRLCEYIAGMIHSENGQSLAINAPTDHIHILTILPKEKSMSDMMRNIKSHSTLWLRKVFPECRHFTWQAGYAAFSISFAGTDKVKQYIHNQDEHHKMTSFQEEYIQFLKKHNIEFNERYIWE